MAETSQRAAGRIYRRRILLSSLGYAGALFAEQWLLRHGALSVPARFALATLPALAIVAMFVALGRYLIDERDEYVRARTIRQMLWGTGLALSALTLWGFPEDAGLLPRLPTYFAAVFWFAGFGLTGLAIKLLDR